MFVNCSKGVSMIQPVSALQKLNVKSTNILITNLAPKIYFIFSGKTTEKIVNEMRKANLFKHSFDTVII